MMDLSARGIALRFDPAFGQIVSFTVSDGRRDISPLHTAPWVARGEVLPDGLVPHHYRLGGDFFCAPFGAEEDGAPLHGWPANSAWSIGVSVAGSLVAGLDRPVQGATVTKQITLLDDHPFVYQSHSFSGGSGRLPVANHANLALPNGGLIRTSSKAEWRTPEQAPEQDTAIGRSGLAYPASSTNPCTFPAAGGSVDLTAYPWFPRHDDFVAGIETPGQTIGWTAVTRPVEGDVFLSLRRADYLPMTMLWHSNGGRDYPPWNGRHFGCLGVEEGAAADILGQAFARDFEGTGALRLGGPKPVEVRHVTGAIDWPGGAGIAQIELTGDKLAITGEDGQTRHVPFDASFLTDHPG